MIVILCEPDDHSGLWLASELEPREKVARIVLPEKLIVGSQLSLRIDEQAVDAAVRQADGRVIDGKSVAAARGTFCGSANEPLRGTAPTRRTVPPVPPGSLP